MSTRVLFVSAAMAALCFSARAQFTFIEVDTTARVEASAVDSVTFESFLDEDERNLAIPGTLEGSISASTEANGGIGSATADYDVLVDSESIRFIADLQAQASLGSAFQINASSSTGVAGVISMIGQSDVAVSGSFVLDQPLPVGLFGPALVDIRFQLLGASASQPDLFVNVQHELSSLSPGLTNEIRFIDTATLLPDGEYSLIVQASLITGIQTGGAVSTVELSGRFTARLDFRDTDADGLFDTWETDGIDFDMDGTPELDLPGEGATPGRKDLFVELDVHQSATVTQAALDPMIAGFAAAPVSNPSGVDGINLHIAVDENDLPDFNYFDETGTGSGTVRLQMRAQREERFGTVAQRTGFDPEAIIKAKSLIYRYGVVGGRLTVRSNGVDFTPGGMAELPGDDFIITLRNQNPTPGNQGRTIMHELGHNLGLRHGGNDNFNYKANYFSVMNYMHVFERSDWGPQWSGDLPFDYSRSKLPDVDEFELSESMGIGSNCACTAGRRFVFANDNPILPQQNNPIYVALGGPGDSVDWDVDGAIGTEGFVLDVNRLNLMAPVDIRVHEGFDDWNNLHLKVRGGRNFDFGAVATGESTLDPEIGEFTFEEFDALDARPVVFLDGTSGVCVADVTMDGNLNFFDVSAYIGLYNAQDPAADLAAPFGTFNFFDISAFIAAYNAGCP